ncbi:MAG: DUF1499 domain-containing protein [Pseudomonadota bacterium]
MRHDWDMTTFISFKTLKRSPKPNTCLVAPDGLCLAAEPDLPSPEFEDTPAELFAKLETLIQTERSWIDLAADAEDLKLKFIARSAIMRFKDDVDIAVLPAASGPGSQLAIYSRSRVGYSDLGANRKRVDSLLNKLTVK